MRFIEANIQCPHCWESFTIFVEPMDQTASYIEDCQICCCPILVSTSVDGDELKWIEVAREND